MAGEGLRNRAYNEVTQGFVDTGRSPHYTDLAPVLGVTPDEAREAQHEAADHSLFCWFPPETDYVSSWAPFSNIPNHHRITIGGDQKWFGQCGVEVLLAPRMFPGEEATIDSRCPTSGTSITVRIRDGEILDLTPAAAVVLINHPFDRITTPFSQGDVSPALACNDMHIFRSEEDGRDWSRFDPAMGSCRPWRRSSRSRPIRSSASGASPTTTLGRKRCSRTSWPPWPNSRKGAAASTTRAANALHVTPEQRGGRMTEDWKGLADGLRQSLGTGVPPIAITFHDAIPDVERFAAPMSPVAPDGRRGRVSAGCVFWMKSTARTFTTVPEDHGNCSVGSLTHGMKSLEDIAGNSDVGALLEAGWVTMDAVPQIPAVRTQPAAVTYGPLAETPHDPDLVLLRLSARQLMVLSDAIPGLRVEGKPQCHIVAIARESGEAAASVGCQLSRVRTGMANGEMTCALPAQPAEVVSRLRNTAAVDRIVAAYAADDARRFTD